MPDPKARKLAVSFKDEAAKFQFQSGQEYERVAIVNYIRGLKANQKKLFKETVALGASPQLMQELLTTIENTIIMGHHHDA